MAEYSNNDELNNYEVNRWERLRNLGAAGAFGAANGPVDLTYYAGKANAYMRNAVGISSDQTTAARYKQLEDFRVNPTGIRAIDDYRQQVQGDHPEAFTAGEIAGPGGIAAWLAKAAKYKIGVQGIQRLLQSNKARKGGVATGGAVIGESVTEPLQDAFYRANNK